MNRDLKAFAAVTLLTSIGLMATGVAPPTPATRPLTPLTPITSEPLREIWEAPLVADANGQERQEGLVGMIVSQDFNTGVLASLNARVELIEDSTPLAPSEVRMLVVRVPDEEIDAFVAATAAAPGVVTVSKAFMQYLDTYDPHWDGQYYAGLLNIDLGGFWDLLGMGVPAVRVAVIDGGVTEVPDLAGKIEPGRNFTLFGALDDTSDDNGHGTQVASIIAATANNGIQIAGIAPGVHIVPIKACLPAGPCPGLIVANALQYVRDEVVLGRDIQVVNMSFGSRTSDDTENYWLGELHKMGVFLVAAAGNSGAEGEGLEFPGRSGYVTGVGGIYPNQTRDPDSNYGDDLDVVASMRTYAINHHDNPVYSEGTSFSAPVISGLLALEVSGSFVEHFEGNVRAHMTDSVFVPHQPWWDDQTGNGVPNYVLYNMWDMACSPFDFNGDREVDVYDLQLIAFHYGGFLGDSGRYERRFDLQPRAGDRDIDIADWQKESGRAFWHCP
jgi:hypothetical protein